MSPMSSDDGSVLDDTITPSTFVHLESSGESLETAAPTTACTTLDGHQKLKEQFQRRGVAYNNGKRRPFQRLPIPSLLVDTTSTDVDNTEAVKLGYGPAQVREEEARDEEDFPQSPGHSPLSRIQRVGDKKETVQLRRRFSLSPASTVLSLGRNSKDSRSRNRSVSDAHLQLHPSPPRLAEQLDLGIAKNRVLKRKPIPRSLLVDFESESAEKQRSWSVPDILSDSLVDEVGPKFEVGNQLGLFYPSTSAVAHAKEDKVTHSSPTSCDNFDTLQQQGLAQAHGGIPPPLPPQLQYQRLRRTTRSISESHGQDRRVSVDTEVAHPSAPGGRDLRRSPKELCGFFVDANKPGSSRLTATSIDATRNGSTEVENNRGRGRTRSGSVPIWTSSPSEGAEHEHRRYSADTQEGQVLRRVSRKREGEMRSVYLSQPSHSPCTSTFPPDQPHTTLLSENEGIEVLRTPDPSIEATTMSSSLSSSTSSLYGFDTLRSRDGSLASRTRSSSETSMASLLVLQQHIQQRNHLRQFAPPSGDPHFPPEIVHRRSRELSEEGWSATENAFGRREASAKVEKTGERRMLAREYGAMRVRGFSIDGVGDTTDRCELGHLDRDGDGGREDGSPKAPMGLRHMFSNPHFPTAAVDNGRDVDQLAMGSLRERRAKPPISIAVATSTEPDSKSKAPLLVAGASPLRKKQSKTQLFSPLSSIYSPPPCPPPAAPLPELPMPKSAPLVHTSATGVGGLKRILLPKRSFVRSSSTPVSPLNATPRRTTHTPQHGQTQSQGQNTYRPPEHAPANAAVTGFGQGWTSPPSDETLLTPPLTGLPSLTFDQQPNTPSSASALTPLRPNAGVAPGKFDSLLAFLSSSSSKSQVPSEGEAKSASSGSGKADPCEPVVVAASAPVASGVVYGLAL